MLLASLLAVSAKPASASTIASLSIGDRAVSFGERKVFSGSGFQAGERVALWLTSPTGVVISLGSTFARRDGTFANFSPNFTLRAPSVPGTWFVTARGVTSGSQNIQTFTLLSPTLGATATMGANNQVIIRFNGANYHPNERVSLWVTDGNGRAFAINGAWTTRGGALPAHNQQWSFQATSGPYWLSAYGPLSGQTVVARINM